MRQTVTSCLNTLQEVFAVQRSTITLDVPMPFLTSGSLVQTGRSSSIFAVTYEAPRRYSRICQPDRMSKRYEIPGREEAVYLFIHIMTVDARIVMIQNLPLWVLIVSRIAIWKWRLMQVTLTLSLLH